MSQTAPALISHPSFELITAEDIPAIGVTIAEYQHRKTGASHYHIASENSENVFLVALRTVPKDSTGVAHILEHTALCGSEKYPVRDPFFMMIRRSLNSFMNAFTSSDWTAYPFASTNRKDFDNLLNVYLDAVFFSRLDPLDFAQEGHRLEFIDPEDPNSELCYKGVVYNEMKGAMSSVNSQLWHTLCKYLYPTTTYHYNSGGDPASIPNLSYSDLHAFYKTHYHPSNAIFMTFGDIPAEEHQAKFETLALSRFEKLDVDISVPRENRYIAPMSAEEYYPLPSDEDVAAKTHIVFAWLLGESTCLDSLLEAQLLAGVLLDNSASPLLHALETTEFGTAPSPLCGLEDSTKEMAFVCGIEGSEATHADAVEKLILDTLSRVAREGVDYDNVEAVLHQLELEQREISGDGYPYGLQLILTALGSATHRGKPIDLLNMDPAIKALREKIQDPEYIKGLCEQLLHNPHRVRLVFSPDQDMQAQMDNAEKARLANIASALSEQERAKILEQTKALLARQALQEDESILPKVTLDDVPLDTPNPIATKFTMGSLPCTRYGQGTNGLVYQQLYMQLPQLCHDDLQILPIYCQLLCELGLGEQNYLQTQARQAQICGSISAYFSLRSHVDDEQECHAYLVLSSKALLRNASAQAALMRDTLDTLRFDELDRIVDIVAQIRARRESSITGNGHGLAMTAACSGMSPIAQLNHQLGGLCGIQAIRALCERLNEPSGQQAFADQLKTLHANIMSSSRQLVVIAEEHKLAALCDDIDSTWSDYSNAVGEPLSLTPLREQRKQFWQTNSQVNFCAKAYPSVTADHPDAGALTVLSAYLRNGYLHRCIREQGGAYGGGASQDSSTAAFRFYSYRDPRLQETLVDFDAAIEWMLNTEVSPDALEQAILGIVSSIDKPSSPAGEAKQNFQNNLYGRDEAHRKRFRERVLSVGAEDLLRVTRQYLDPAKASVAVVSNENNASELAEWLSTEQFELQKI